MTSPIAPRGLTKEDLFYWKVKNDPVWYIENFFMIRDKSSKLVPFKLNPAQLEVMRIFNRDQVNKKPKRYIILKARQMGLSTLIEALIARQSMTEELINAMIIAHEDKGSQNLFAMSKLYFDEMPDVVKPMKKYSNERALVFENPTANDEDRKKNPGLRSKITVSTAGAGEAGRSSTVHSLHASEVAFFPDARTTMLGLLQSIPDMPNTLVALESTANGVGDWFHNQWLRAERGESEYTPIFLPWFIDPGYTRPFRSDGEEAQFIREVDAITRTKEGDEVRTYEYNLMTKHHLTYEQLNWRKYTVANKCEGDEMLFMQEYPSTAEESFISSGRPRFAISSLKKYQTITTKPEKRGYLELKDGIVELIEDPHGYVTVWQEPDPDKYYCIGADVAEGLAHGDYSSATVGDSESFDIVAKWHGHIDPDLYGDELEKLGIYYNRAYLGVENNNHGLTTLTTLKRSEYWNLYFTKTFDKITESVSQKLGWTTSSRTKPFMIDKLAEFVREMHLGIYSDKIISEMYTYVIADNGKTNAQAGCYDDTVIACAIMLQLMLEGRGETYAPEVPIEDRRSMRREVIDPLFENDDTRELSI